MVMMDVAACAVAITFIRRMSINLLLSNLFSVI